MSDSGMRFSLGDLIEHLAKRPGDQYVNFDFGGLCPTTLASYRGYYDDAALGFGAEMQTVDVLMTELRRAMGLTYCGWKGGEYQYDLGSRLWVANPGNTSDTAIVDIEPKCGWMTVLRTAWIP